VTTILIAEDDDFLRESLRKLLHKNGYQVLEAENGLKALDIFERYNVDLAIVDIIMPEKDGLEMIIEITKLSPNLPILAMSAGGRAKNMEFLEVALEFGAEAVLSKPFPFPELIEKVNSLLASKSVSDR
jgi:CheY-like chemotaxis protein